MSRFLHGLLALFLAAQVHAFTVTGGESDTSSSLWWFIPGAGCVGGVASSNWDLTGTDVPTAICGTGVNLHRGLLQFPDAGGAITKPFAQQTLLLPQAPTPATAAYVSAAPLTVSLMWYTGGADLNTAHAVRWCAAVICQGDGDIADSAAYGTEVCVDDLTKGTASMMNLAVITLPTASTTTCAANKVLHLKLSRNSAHANDTMTQSANLESVTVAWQRFQ